MRTAGAAMTLSITFVNAFKELITDGYHFRRSFLSRELASISFLANMWFSHQDLVHTVGSQLADCVYHDFAKRLGFTFYVFYFRDLVTLILVPFVRWRRV